MLLFIGPRKLKNHFIVYTAFMSNFIGITFARSLHYQFYCWYFHTLPYLLWTGTKLPLIIKVGIMISIEIAFNVYPATPYSSLLLQLSHILLLISLFLKPAPLMMENVSNKSINSLTKNTSTPSTITTTTDDITTQLSTDYTATGTIPTGKNSNTAILNNNNHNKTQTTPLQLSQPYWNEDENIINNDVSISEKNLELAPATVYESPTTKETISEKQYGSVTNDLSSNKANIKYKTLRGNHTPTFNSTFRDKYVNAMTSSSIIQDSSASGSGSGVESFDSWPKDSNKLTSRVKLRESPRSPENEDNSSTVPLSNE